ncbi:MAG: alpha/beta hydrolase [Verrucomicrobia bacterium]|nr:alpha/beta hydrolase [Verrucomicrobiota bacterium]MCH8527695.1 alpha/beta hydrolase [Kiritimatiellia bacterium]
MTANSPPHSKILRGMLLAALTVILLTSLVTLWLFLGAHRDPTGSAHGMIGSALWPTLGPHLALLAWSGVVLSLIALRSRWKRFALPVLMFSAAAAWGATVIVAAIVNAAAAAGGHVNVVSALRLRSMTGGGPDREEVFVTRGGQELRVAIYHPAAAEEAAPVLLYIHGGGFMAGSFLETDADLRWFAQNGWLVFSVEYRLFTEDQPTWDLAPQDIVSAFAWVNAHAPALGGDMGRFAVLGDSAGGNLALNVSYAAALGRMRDEEGGALPVPGAVAVQYPAVDALAIYEHGYPVPGFEPSMLVSGYIGGDPYAFPGRVEAVSSYAFLGPGLPATLVLAPEKDGLVPSWSVFRFVDHARLAGVDIELVRIPFANHVYNQLAANSLGNQARRTVTLRFLSEQLP